MAKEQLSAQNVMVGVAKEVGLSHLHTSVRTVMAQVEKRVLFVMAGALGRQAHHFLR